MKPHWKNPFEAKGIVLVVDLCPDPAALTVRPFLTHSECSYTLRELQPLSTSVLSVFRHRRVPAPTPNKAGIPALSFESRKQTQHSRTENTKVSQKSVLLQVLGGGKRELGTPGKRRFSCLSHKHDLSSHPS